MALGSTRRTLLFAAVAAAARQTRSYSPLWGVNGERWKPEDILPDFSYAGYRAGESPIPHAAAQWDLKRDFHAAGDGHTDDTEALEKAFAAIPSGVLFIPRGVYVISRRFQISKANFVLRGAG
ncbi:MAG: glycosyl hydrolase family 28-related protein, partial [Bryobacteraceae bacterium]